MRKPAPWHGKPSVRGALASLPDSRVRALQHTKSGHPKQKPHLSPLRHLVPELMTILTAGCLPLVVFASLGSKSPSWAALVQVKLPTREGGGVVCATGAQWVGRCE